MNDRPSGSGAGPHAPERPFASVMAGLAWPCLGLVLGRSRPVTIATSGKSSACSARTWQPERAGPRNSASAAAGTQQLGRFPVLLRGGHRGLRRLGCGEMARRRRHPARLAARVGPSPRHARPRRGPHVAGRHRLGPGRPAPDSRATPRHEPMERLGATSPHTKANCRAEASKFLRLGNTSSNWLADSPNQLPSVAAIWSTAIVGSSRPWPTSSGPLWAITGATP